MTLKLITAAVIITSAVLFAGNWKSDAEKAKVSFSVKGPFGTVNGNFTGLQTDIQFDEKDLGSSSITASIDAKTVNSGVGLRNRHLREKEEWFNTDKYPRISFHAKKFEKTASGYKASGELTIKNITKPVEIAFTFSPRENTGLFKGAFTIKREDFKLGPEGGSTGAVVTINLEVPVTK